MDKEQENLLEDGKGKKVLIFGITGQDGHYLTKLLLRKNYTVVGVVRRSSSPNLGRCYFFLKDSNFSLENGDITDFISVLNIIKKVEPDWIFNLAAQSHVGTSFNEPFHTLKTTGEGCLNILEAVRSLGIKCKIYQASSSEMFGDSCKIETIYNIGNYKVDVETKFTPGQDINTKFNPQSPYAISKVVAHQFCQLYRKAYGLDVRCGVLFNHETLSYSTPLIIKNNEEIDILPIGDVARLKTGVLFDINDKVYQDGKPNKGLYVWDKDGWTEVTWVSGYPHKQDKNPRIINSRNSVYTATGSHVCIMDNDSEIKTSDLKVGDKVKLVSYPNIEDSVDISLELAEFLGMMVGDGNLHGKVPRFTNKDILLKERFAYLWKYLTGNEVSYKDSYSGFTGKKVGQVEGLGSCDFDLSDIYVYYDKSVFGHTYKKVPRCILNSNVDIMEAFLVGYNNCDGLKNNKCKYKFKNFKTNSPTLAAGLLFLVSKVTQQKYNITVEESWNYGKQQFYYSINLLSDSKSVVEKYDIVKSLLVKNYSQRKIYRETGISRNFIRKINNGYIPNNTHHLELCNKEIKKIIDIPNYDGWFFDLETKSGTFHAGIGQGLVHNSEMRGEEFVTRKITRWIGKYKVWHCPIFEVGQLALMPEQDYKNYLYNSLYDDVGFYKLQLGNLDSIRDWGHAEDYVRAMVLIMQHDNAEDWVVATGETHSIKDFLKKAFEVAQLGSWEEYVSISDSLKRPAEVPYLKGDSTPIREKLGWKPLIDFNTLVERMVNNDIKLAKNER